MSITEFLLARIAEDEAWASMAQDASDETPWFIGSGPVKADVFTGAGLRVAETRSVNVSRHIARHDPARVLRECEAKRRIVDEHAFMAAHESRDFGFSNGNCLTCRVQGPCATLRRLATVYADHSDYDEAWRP